MRQAVTTKYINPTDKKPSRIQAKSGPGSIYISYDSELSSDENHRKACEAYLSKYKWKGQYHAGTVERPDGVIVVWVQVDPFDKPAVYSPSGN